MKVVRHASEKITAAENDTMIYQKDDSNPQISLFPANRARTLASRFAANYPNDTDELPEAVTIDGRSHRPLVCPHPHLPGNYIAGYLDVERDTLFLCEYPIPDASLAARCSYKLIVDHRSDEYDLAQGCEKTAA